jgi:hypothetical protein
MKKLLIALAAVLVSAATYAQGTINFNTRFATAGVDAPVTLTSTTGPGAGPAYSAALYLVNGSTLTLIPSSVTTFRDGSSNPLFAKYINAVTATVDGVATGSPATVRMRAWLTSRGSYDAAVAAGAGEFGESGNLSITALGGGALPPGDLPSTATFTGFVIPVPEPSTLALGALGAAALLLRRRK